MSATTDTMPACRQAARWHAFAQRVVANNFAWWVGDARGMVSEPWAASYWNDASGLPAFLRPDAPQPGDDYHRPHLAGVDDRRVVPDQDVECPSCGGSGWASMTVPSPTCALCGDGEYLAGTGRVSIEQAVVWELERPPWPHVNGLARRLIQVEPFLDDVLWVPESQIESDNESLVRQHGITTAELARRLAPVWRWVREGRATMEPSARTASSVSAT